jgi:hypothetical protein
MRPLAVRPSSVLAIALGVVLLGGCAPYSGTPAQKVQEWAKHSMFKSDNDTVVNDIIRIREAVKTGTVKQVRTICGGLASDAGTTYTTLPAPDQALTNALNAADILFVDAATACSGVSSVTSSVMNAALTKLTSGLADLIQAQEILKSHGVVWDVRL